MTRNAGLDAARSGSRLPALSVWPVLPISVVTPREGDAVGRPRTLPTGRPASASLLPWAKDKSRWLKMILLLSGFGLLSSGVPCTPLLWQ